MISCSKDETYTYQDGDESKQIHMSALILESLPNSVINSCYESYLNTSTKAVYKLSESFDVLMNDKTVIPFERGDLTGYYTTNKLIGDYETHEFNATEIAVKTNGVCVIINISFSDEKDFSQLDIDSVISAVCDLVNAIRSHSLYSLDKVYYEFYDERNTGDGSMCEKTGK